MLQACQGHDFPLRGHLIHLYFNHSRRCAWTCFAGQRLRGRSARLTQPDRTCPRHLLRQLSATGRIGRRTALGDSHQSHHRATSRTTLADRWPRDRAIKQPGSNLGLQSGRYLALILRAFICGRAFRKPQPRSRGRVLARDRLASPLRVGRPLVTGPGSRSLGG